MPPPRSLGKPDMPPLPPTREGAISVLRKYISEGTGKNIPNVKRALRLYTKDLPEVFEPVSELEPPIAARVEELEGFLEDPPPEANELDMANIRAVIDAWKKGTFKFKVGEVAIFWSGKMMLPAIPLKTWENEVETYLEEWAKTVPNGRMWEESLPRGPLPQRLASLAIATHNEDQHHLLEVDVSKFADSDPISVTLLDDTRSTFMELYVDGLELLGINPHYSGWSNWVTLSTANGPVRRHSIRIWVQLKDASDRTMIPATGILAVYIPERSGGNGYRYSGMWVRRNLYQATAPDGQGIMFLGMKRNGVTSQLPAL